MNRCHLLVEWAGLAAAAACAIALFIRARCSVSVSSSLAAASCRDHSWQSDIDLDVGLPAAVDGRTAVTRSGPFSCTCDAAGGATRSDTSARPSADAPLAQEQKARFRPSGDRCTRQDGDFRCVCVCVVCVSVQRSLKREERTSHPPPRGRGGSPITPPSRRVHRGVRALL